MERWRSAGRECSRLERVNRVDGGASDRKRPRRWIHGGCGFGKRLQTRFGAAAAGRGVRRRRDGRHAAEQRDRSRPATTRTRVTGPGPPARRARQRGWKATHRRGVCAGVRGEHKAICEARARWGARQARAQGGTAEGGLLTRGQCRCERLIVLGEKA